MLDRHCIVALLLKGACFQFLAPVAFKEGLYTMFDTHLARAAPTRGIQGNDTARSAGTGIDTMHCTGTGSGTAFVGHTLISICFTRHIIMPMHCMHVYFLPCFIS
jgi:hypothetical protein